MTTDPAFSEDTMSTALEVEDTWGIGRVMGQVSQLAGAGGWHLMSMVKGSAGPMLLAALG